MSKIRYAPKEDLQKVLNYLHKNKIKYEYYDEYPMVNPEIELIWRHWAEMLLFFIRNKK
jgi:hypothetical protein